MAANDLQILIVVDVYPGVSEEQLEKMLPPERKRLEILRLSEFGAPRLDEPPRTKPVDWFAMGDAIEKVAVRVHEFQDAARPHSTVLYVGGRAPLAAFVHLGFLFTKSVQNIVVLNTPHAGGPWEPFSMDAPPTNMVTHEIFDKVIGFPDEPSSTTGRVGFVVDSGRRSKEPTEPTEPFATFIEQHKDPVGTILQLRTWEPLVVTDVKMPAIVRQFAQRMSSLAHLFPRRRGLALFVAAPTQVAFAMGRAMSPNPLCGDVWLTEYLKEKNAYEKVYSLPYVPRLEMEIPRTPDAILARERVFQNILDALADLQAHVDVQHVPDKLLSNDERARFVKRLRKLKIARESIDEQPFQLRVLEGECHIGAGILQALVRSTTQQQKDFAKLLLLHEVVHDWQALRNTNHPNIGRAGFVLEHIDYLADMFAVRTLVNVDLHRGGLDVQENMRRRVEHWLDMVLHGIAAFDRAEQGDDKMERLAERRLRRYLLWHVQRARARTIENVAHFESMMTSALTVELAPLTGWIDAKRWEKMVRGSLPDTELCIAIDGRLIRESRRAGFEPEVLVDAVRAYDRERIQKEVYAVVDQYRAILMAWTQES